MHGSLDRVADLFEAAEVRALFTDSLPARYAPYPLSELAKAARDQLGAPHEVSILGRELRRAGLAIHHARHADQQADDDHAELLNYVRAGCDSWTHWNGHRGPELVVVHFVNPCEELLAHGGELDRDDAYAALRGLATRLTRGGGWRDLWALHIADDA
ncbi:hypothetical protein [Streptomyces sp. NPDC058653]|uniref:hypothetical protein n=1 Tax=Streptomyces sp. NPDC058653 TaxID=3346576 RepID=UPI0036473AB6